MSQPLFPNHENPYSVPANTSSSSPQDLSSSTDKSFSTKSRVNSISVPSIAPPAPTERRGLWLKVVAGVGGLFSGKTTGGLRQDASAGDIKEYLGNWISGFKGAPEEKEAIRSACGVVLDFLEEIVDNAGKTNFSMRINASTLPNIFHTDLIKRNLKYLEISGSTQGGNVLELPELRGNLTEIEELTLIGDNQNPQTLQSIGSLTNLIKLSIHRYEGLSELPESIGHLTHLQVLELQDTGLTSLPASIASLNDLKEIAFSHNPQLKEVSPTVRDFIKQRASEGEMELTLERSREELIKSLETPLTVLSEHANAKKIKTYLQAWAQQGDDIQVKQKRNLICNQIIIFLENPNGKIVLEWDTLPNIFHTRLVKDKLKDLEITSMNNNPLSAEEMLGALQLENLVNLERLSFKNCEQLRALPEEVFSNLNQLRELEIVNSGLEKLPISLVKLAKSNSPSSFIPSTSYLASVWHRVSGST